MERRVLLAVVLSIGLIFLVQVMFPTAPPPRRAPVGDTVAVVDTVRPAVGDTAERETARPELPAPRDTAAGEMAEAPDRAAFLPDTIHVLTDLYEYDFSTRGAALVGARLREFDSYAEGDPDSALVELVPEGERFFTYGVAVGGDTVRIGDMEFSASSSGIELSPGHPTDSLAFTYTFPGERGARFVVVYRFQDEGYLVNVEGRVEGLEGRGYALLADMATELRSNEKNVSEDHTELAMVTNGQESGVVSVAFKDVAEGGAQPAAGGPFHWVAIKNKYFLVAAIAPSEGQMFGGATLRGTGIEFEGRVTTSMPVPAGTEGFRFSIYTGPQDYGRLNHVGQDLQDVNSYGYKWLQPVIRPLVAIVMPILVWIHTRFDLAYGWVLILFGVMMRVVLFPLYQKSMRAQIGQMRLQPVVQEIREKYKDDPQKMQQEMMRVYKEEGVNPLAGCLPMLVPMPVLFTLFFVFRSTIEFRGVPFLWLPDLSLKDPLYIIPLVMGASMFLLQYIGQKSMSQSNTQMKVMMYAMPVFFTFLFANFPSGLNLYYTTSNLASLPQQLYIARERKAAGVAGGASDSSSRPGDRPPKKDGGGG
jgi:YidC/Oxa1 family membrane protein insertase